MNVLVPPLSKSDAQRALVLADVLGVPFEQLLPLGEELPRDVMVLRDGLLALRAAPSQGAGDATAVAAQATLAMRTPLTQGHVTGRTLAMRRRGRLTGCALAMRTRGRLPG